MLKEYNNFILESIANISLSSDNICYLYELVDPRNMEVRYVGKTNNMKIRHSAHNNLNTAKRLKTHNASWIIQLKNLGLEPLMRIIKIGSIQNIHQSEIDTIKKYRELGYRLTNMTNGGDGVCGKNPETIEKIKKALTGKKNPWSVERKLKQAKQVVGMDLSTGIEYEFLSIADAGRHVNGHKHHIKSCCIGRKNHKTYKNYKWRFKDGKYL